MKKITYKNINKHNTYFVDNEGKKLYINNGYGYDNRIDLINMVYYQGEEAIDHKNLPTLNDLIENGTLKKEELCQPVTWYKSSDFYPLHLNQANIDSIRAYFKKKGFNITKKAIIHNFKAWRHDLKSGYRDEKNGYHLFSACGCNPLAFTATKLHEYCNDWQQSYTA